MTERVRGEVERLVYCGDETATPSCRLRVPGKHDLVSLMGSLPGIQPGERLELDGCCLITLSTGFSSRWRAAQEKVQSPSSDSTAYGDHRSPTAGRTTANHGSRYDVVTPDRMVATFGTASGCGQFKPE